MAELSTLNTTSGTPSIATNILSHIVTTLPETMTAEKLGDMIPRASWSRFKAVNDKISLEVDEQNVPKRDPMFRKLSRKQQNPSPWDMMDIRSVTMGKPLHILQDVMKLRNLDSSNFHLQLEDGLREHINSYNNRTLKQIHQATVKLASMLPTMMLDSVLVTLDTQLQVRTMPATPLSDFFLAIVSTFGALYQAEFITVYFKTDHATHSPTIAHYWFEHLTKTLEGPPSFSEATLFAEGDNSDHDYCAKITRKMLTVSSVSNWTMSWNLIMGKCKVNSTEKNC